MATKAEMSRDLAEASRALAEAQAEISGMIVEASLTAEALATAQADAEASRLVASESILALPAVRAKHPDLPGPSDRAQKLVDELRRRGVATDPTRKAAYVLAFRVVL